MSLDSVIMTDEESSQLSADAKAELDTLLRLVRYHELMSKKYRSASRSPWLPVAPDPPPPAG